MAGGMNDGGLSGSMGGGMGGDGFSMGGGGMHRGMGMGGDDNSPPAPCSRPSHAKGSPPSRMREVTPDQAMIGDEQH